MTTLRQMQIARRLHHRTQEALASKLGPRTIIEVEAADLQSLLNALWVEIDRGNAAEDRLANKPVQRRVPHLRLFAPDSSDEQQPA